MVAHAPMTVVACHTMNCCCLCKSNRNLRTTTQRERRSESSSGLVDEASHFSRQDIWLSEVCGVPRRRLTVRNGDDGSSPVRETRLETINRPEEIPSQVDIRSWSESFDKIMQSCYGQQAFREFLRSEYSEENMLFWLACEDLKSEQNAEQIEAKARMIYEDYISVLSPKEVSVDAKVRESINHSLAEPTSHTFDEAQLQIYTLMQRDSYPRFLNSQYYKRLLQ